MSAEETPTGVPTHRPGRLPGGLPPLPSVRIPLLRDERRASQKRQLVQSVVLGGVAVAAVAGALLLPRFLHHDDRGRRQGVVPAIAAAAGPVDQTGVPAQPEGGAAASAPAPAATPDAGTPVPPAPPLAQAPVPHPPEPSPTVEDDTPPVAPGATTRETHAFGSATGFQSAVLAAGANREESDMLTAALDHVIDFRHCQQGDQLTFERDRVGLLLRFEYKKDRIHVYEAVREPGGRFHGQQVQVAIERVRVAKGGYVAGSLGDALDGLGLGRALVATFVDSFAGKVNFGTHTRQGDSFRVIVDEERVEGEFLRWGTVHALEYVGARAGTHRAYWYEPRGGEADYYDDEGRSVHGGWLRMPVAYDHIASPFDPHRLHPILHRVMPHNGVDLSAGTGTPVYAAASGTVIWAGEKGPNGNLVGLRHEGGFESYYAHLSRFAPGIHVGMEIHQRQLVGYVGSTGRSTGPHLHFGLTHHGHFVDPMHELNGPGRLMPAAALPAFRRLVRSLGAELGHVALAPAPSHAAPAEPDGGDDD